MRYVILHDVAGTLEPAWWGGPNGRRPIVFNTRREAEKELAQDQIDEWTQVLNGDRALDEVNAVDEIHPCSYSVNGGLTVYGDEDGERSIYHWTPEQLRGMTG